MVNISLAQSTPANPDSPQLEEGIPLFNFGVYGGLNINMHSADFNKLTGCENCSPGFENGTGIGFSIGGLFDYQLNKTFLVGLRFGYSDISGILSVDEKIGNSNVIDAATGQAIAFTDINAEYVIDSKLSLFDVEPMIIYKPIKNLNLSAGLRVGFLLTKSFSQHEEIISPDGIVFINEGTTKRNIMNNSEIPNPNNLQLHFSLGAGYEFPTSKHVTLMPEAKYYLALTDIADVSWKANSLYAGLAVKYYIFPKVDKPVIEKDIFIRDTTVKYIAGLKKSEIKRIANNLQMRYEEDKKNSYEIYEHHEVYELRLPKVTTIALELFIVGINADGSRVKNPKIVIEEIETAELFPILPYVFFEENSSDISKSGLTLLTPEEVTDFTEDSLQWDIMSIYSQMLNIIAYRLQNTPKATIIITGTNNNMGEEEGNADLSKARANAVRDYFTKTWGIAADRIEVKSRNLPTFAANNSHEDGQTENQRAELYSTNNDITKPISLSFINKSITPPKIEITPKITAEEPINDWQYTIVQDEDYIRKFAGNGRVETQLWNLDQKPLPLNETTLDVTLKVKDEALTEAEINKKIDIEQLTIKEKRFEQKGDTIIEKFSLILFDYNSSVLKNEHRLVLDDIKSRITPGSKVEISGYADRTGTQELNKELAAKRTNTIREYLGIPYSQLSINNVGSHKLLYDNATPQGRSYCRTVIITIATPIKGK